MNAPGVTLNFDATNIKVEDRFEVLPAGWQNCTVTNTERKPSSKKPQNSYLEVEHTIMDGQYAGRKMFNRINLWNDDATAMEIAYTGANGIAALQQAVGVFQCANSQQLHGIPLKVKIKVIPAGPGKDGKNYEAKNEVVKYAHITAQVGDNDAPGAGGSIASGVAGAPNGQPPWAAQGSAAAAAPAPAASAAPAPAPAAATQPWPQPGQPAAADAQPPWAANAGAAAAPPPPAAAAPPPPNTQVTHVMLPAAGALSYDDYRKSGWTDQQMIDNGIMAAPQAAPPPPANAAPPPPSSGANAGAKPPWQT
jgi:hypothetical protein